MKQWKRMLSVFLAVLLAMGTFAAQAEERTADGGNAYFEKGSLSQTPIQSMEDAASVASEVAARLGGDGRIQFRPWRTVTDTRGNRYYVFQQMYAETTVSGGAIKIVTDPEGNMLGYVSSVETALPEVEEAAGISAEQAEAIVTEQMTQAYPIAPEPLPGRTGQVILPVNRELDMEAEKEESRFVWAVYTANPESRLSRDSDLPYLTHYVAMDGAYLYSLPCIIPGDDASASGYQAAYAFEFMEPAPYTGTITLSSGKTMEISLDVMRDTRTGMYYLGNVERRIAVADCYPFLYENGRTVLEASKDNADWNEKCLLALYNYCRAWDYYNEIGWQGGDGLGTPILILKDFCDEKHEPIDNAAYAGRYYGWQIFLSSEANDFAQCLDILAHEFTHCVTGSVMTYNAYMNDYGAINEALSDIQGNLCEMYFGATEDTAWVLGENSQTPARSMSDPHQYHQPEYAWDLFYVPHVAAPTGLNDRGGVHSNSSLLNSVAYSLCAEGGMTIEEARAFWFAVDCAAVPGTDYAQLSELMPWVLEILGMERYQAALKAAVGAVRLRMGSAPDSISEDLALLTLTLPEDERFQDGHWALGILSVDVEAAIQRVKDIWNAEGDCQTAMAELLDALIPAGEPGQEAPAGIVDWVKDCFFTDETERGDIKDKYSVMKDGLRDWFRKYLGGFLFAGTGAAGQDGRTVRMVCRPGLTVPVLMRMEFDDNSGNMLTMGGLVYTMGSWIDVGRFLEIITNEDMLRKWAGEMADRIVNIQQSDTPVLQRVFDGLTLLYSRFTDPAWLKANLFFEIRGGEILEIPSTGIENAVILEGEVMNQLVIE